MVGQFYIWSIIYSQILKIWYFILWEIWDLHMMVCVRGIELVSYCEIVNEELCEIWWNVVTLEVIAMAHHTHSELRQWTGVWGLYGGGGVFCVLLCISSAACSFLHSHCEPCGWKHPSPNMKSPVIWLFPNVPIAVEQI